MGPEPPEEKHDAFAALREANYRLFASGFVFSSLGLQAMSMAIGWEIYHRTQDSYAVGVAGLMRALPVVLMALPAGWVIDHVDRKRVLILTQLGFAFMSAALALVSWKEAPLWLMYATLLLMGCVRSFNGPTRSSLLPDLVPKKAFQNAVTWNSGVFHISGVGGPLLAGWLIAIMAEKAWAVYAVTSLSCLMFAVLATGLHVLPHENKPAALPADQAPPSTLGRLRGMFAGAKHVWREKTILATISLDLFGVLLGGVTALLPEYCDKIIQTGPIGLGWLRASTYLGAISMALVLMHAKNFRNAGPMLLWSVTGYGVCIVGFGFSEVYWLSFLLLFASGAFDNVSVVIRHVLVQMRTPRALRGRVSAVNSVFIECSNELGAYESGAVARAFGPVASAVSGGIGTLVVVAIIAMCVPQVRAMRRIEELPETQASAPVVA